MFLHDKFGRAITDLRISITDRCNYKCVYCRTGNEGALYGDLAFAEYLRMARVLVGMGITKVRLTGGEPLLQKNSLPLMTTLCGAGFTVLLETSGAHDIAPVDPRVRRIMDLKCPSSGEAARNRWENLPHLKGTDEIKFVVGTFEDYEWTKKAIKDHQLAAICPLLVSWVHPLAPEQKHKSLKAVPAGQTLITRQQLAETIVADALPVRFQVQLHKLLWPPEMRGV